MSHRPTTMQLYLDHCPRAVDHYERGTPQNRDIFTVGTVAHEILFAIGQGMPIEPIVASLIATGRTGDDSEGPMRPDAVFEGRDLALAWSEAHPIPDGAFFEYAFAFDGDWKPCAWDQARFRTRVDVVHRRTEEDEDGHDIQDLVITDYKSAWPATETELDTLQRRAQAVSGWLSWGDEIGSITIAVANLRRRQVFERVIPLDEEGVALLQQWQRDLEVVMDAIDVREPDGQRPARPGARCGGCPYAASCEPARDLLARHGASDTADVVRRYIAARALAAELEPHIRSATARWSWMTSRSGPFRPRPGPPGRGSCLRSRSHGSVPPASRLTRGCAARCLDGGAGSGARPSRWWRSSGSSSTKTPRCGRRG